MPNSMEDFKVSTVSLHGERFTRLQAHVVMVFCTCARSLSAQHVVGYDAIDTYMVLRTTFFTICLG